MPATVFLDLYGVLADARRMEVAYNERMAAILHRRHGRSGEWWRETQLASEAWYVEEGAKLDALPGGAREGEAWVERVRRLKADQVLWMFREAGLLPPPDPVAYAEDLEAETVRGIDALYPDARPAIDAIRAAGHPLFLSTNANRSNAESALIGSGIRDRFDGVAMLETAKAKKDRPAYWRRAFGMAHVAPREAVVVDDIARYLDLAAGLGATCVQLVRPGLRRDPFAGPVLDTLAALPAFLDGHGRTRSRRR